MQFQRLQTLYIILAAVAMFIFCFTPFGIMQVPEGVQVDTTNVFPSEVLGIMLPGVMAGIMLVISLLLYNSLKFQYTIVLIGLLFTMVSIGCTSFEVYKGLHGYDATFSPWVVTLAVAAICEIAALGRIRHDRHLLASYNRLR